ncbi:hypothetical protein [Micromonospora zamorensis]|uniref:hypothetical protein n=1 Tax=Micromonospora zamorensis TaxID=709883 RepID=UPI0033CD2D73
MELQLRMSDKARDFVEQVLHEMLVRFPITRDEAVGRVNQASMAIIDVSRYDPISKDY